MDPLARTLKFLEEAAGQWSECVLSVGNFDGVHRGHQAILKRLSAAGRELGLPTVVVTFEPHPVEFFRPERPPFRLTNGPQKLKLLRHYGVDVPVVLAFDEALSSLEPEVFARRCLFDALKPRQVLVGYDFHFGKDRRGNPERLLAVGLDAGVQVEVQRAIEGEGGVISSSRVRRLVAGGELDAVRALLRRPFAIQGTVVRGAGRGTGLGFPTANVAPAICLLPATGVYATYLEDGDNLCERVLIG